MGQKFERFRSALKSQNNNRQDEDLFSISRALTLSRDPDNKLVQEYAARERSLLSGVKRPNGSPAMDEFSVWIPDHLWSASARQRNFDNTTVTNADPAIPEGIYFEDYRRYLIDFIPLLNYVTMITGVTGNPSIPIWDDPLGVKFTAEGTALTNTETLQVALTEKKFEPKQLFAEIDVTATAATQIMTDPEMNPFNYDNMLRETADRTLHEQIVKGVMFGGETSGLSGVNEDSGITTNTAVATLAGLKFSDVLDMWDPIRTANIDLFTEGGALVCDEVFFKQLAQVPATTGGSSAVQVDRNGERRLSALGVPVLTTSLDAATSLGSNGFAFMGAWKNVVVMVWDGTEVIYNPFTDVSKRQYSFIKYCDVQVMRPKAFVKQVPAAA